VQLLGAQTPEPCYCQVADSSEGSVDMSNPTQAALAARELSAAHSADRPRLLASRCACSRPSRASGASFATSGDSWLWSHAIDGWKCDPYTPLSGLQECLQPGDSPAGRSIASLSRAVAASSRRGVRLRAFFVLADRVPLALRHVLCHS
jgi:hypothetical protein